jgi:hypothetical protein
MNKYCIILHDRVFETFRPFNYLGFPAVSGKDYFILQQMVKSWGYTEVPINSRIGRQILAKIGAQKP